MIEELEKVHTFHAWIIRGLVVVIITLQLLIGGAIAIRLGPQGYDRLQARANFQQMCEQILRFHPSFVCPPIALER